MRNIPNDKVEEAQERGKQHYENGVDPAIGYSNLGKIWAGIIGDATGQDIPPIPADVVLLMFAASKLDRAARSGLRTDDFVDAVSYVDLAYGAKLDIVRDSDREKLDDARRELSLGNGM